MRGLILLLVLVTGCSSSRDHREPDVAVLVIGSTTSKVFVQPIDQPWKTRVFSSPRLVPEGYAVLRHQGGRSYRLTYGWQSVPLIEELTF